MEDIESDFSATEELKAYGVREVKGGILVGPNEALPERAFALVKYLYEEWDFIYLTEDKYKDLTNT